MSAPTSAPPSSPLPPPAPSNGTDESAAPPSTVSAPKSAVQSLLPRFYRLRRSAGEVYRRLLRRPRSVSEGPNLLPLLIRVLACFSKLDGKILEEEIDSSLGFLRHDYPEAVYSELRKQFRQALNEQPDLDTMAAKLNTQLSPDRKILLGIQLWDLICRAGQQPDQVVAFYKFMAGIGMTAQAIDIVYQLNAPEMADATMFQKGASPLETLIFASDPAADVTFRDLPDGDRLLVYRYHELLLIKNQCAGQVVLNGRPLLRGALGRLYEGQRVVLGERVLTYQELVAYFNAKKNVAVPQVYLAINNADEVSFERARTRDSVLKVRFGLKVQVVALRRINAKLNGIELKPGVHVEAALEDKILFHNDSELPLLELRRRARALGGRFQLIASKSEYLVSNNPSLLDADDILLSPGTGGEVLLKISCDYEQKVGQLEVLQASRSILVGDTPVRTTAKLADGDIIRIDVGQILRCNFSERILEEERNVIRVLEVRDLSHSFRGGERALDSINLTITRGEMVCVMGASGCGKSTLLRTIAGQNWPDGGGVVLNGKSLYDNIDDLRGYIAYIPQDDAFDEQLTIEENLSLAAALRSPHLSGRERARRIDGKLIELGLNERRNSLVGSAVKKSLSGGERKRLNIGLDMIGLADVYLFDEPTSGLSSKDSEHVIDIIRGMSHNKIVMVTIHQPSSKIFQMFNKVILLDKGGRLVFFGTPTEALNYFAKAEHQQHHGVGIEGCASCGSTRPEFIFDVLETPLRDMSGDIIYEENSRGQLVPARRFSPEFWRDKYESHRLLQDMRQLPVKRESAAKSVVPVGPPPTPRQWINRIRWRDEWTQLRTLLRRAFFSKLRNRVNVMTTIVEAPLLAALIAMVLRYNETGDYDFAGAYHIPIYLFLAVTVAMFLGLTNSADDIIRDRIILHRERNLRIRLPYYIFAKTSTLFLFALVQCVLFLLIGNYILQIRGMFWLYLGYTSLTAFCGVATGLLISSLVADAKTAVNIVPLILIPQIIMGGALIKYEEMNRNLDVVYTFKRLFAHYPGGNAEKDRNDNQRSKLRVPFICDFMPMRWSYEGLVVSQAKLNPLTARQERIQAAIQDLASKDERMRKKGKELSAPLRDRLDGLKELLAMLSGMEASSSSGVDDALRQIDRMEERPLLDNISLPDHGSGVTAEGLYVNQKINDLVSKSEMEQSDYRNEIRQRQELNVFFGPYKYMFGQKLSVHLVNTLVLIGFSAIVLGLLHASLHRELER
jgi:ABC-type multidrug transport system ATPase subunit